MHFEWGKAPRNVLLAQLNTSLAAKLVVDTHYRLCSLSRFGNYRTTDPLKKVGTMVEKLSVSEAWSGLLWGDCIGRMHRGWTPEAMDQAFGANFFKSFVTPSEDRLNWLPLLRAVEPVQRRAYVELGLPGHPIQLALFYASVIYDRDLPLIRHRLDQAMSADAFRSPNSELVESMYRMCRSNRPIDPKYAFLFLPTAMYLSLEDGNSLASEEFDFLAHFAADLVNVFRALEATDTDCPIWPKILDSLTTRFDPPSGRTGVSEMITPLLRSEFSSTVQLWEGARDLLRKIPYAGCAVGLFAVARFGFDEVVPVGRLNTRFVQPLTEVAYQVGFEERLSVECALSQQENYARDEYLSERRAVLEISYQ